MGLQLKQEEPALVEVEGVLNEDTGDEEVDAASRRRISALVHVASTAEAELYEHDEMAKAAWSLAPDSAKRPRAFEEYDHAANKRPHHEPGSAGGLADGEPSEEHCALMQKWMIEHAFVLQKMAQVGVSPMSPAVGGARKVHRKYQPSHDYTNLGNARQNSPHGHRRCPFQNFGIVTDFFLVRYGQAYAPDKRTEGASRQCGGSMLTAKGWHPRDKLPVPDPAFPLSSPQGAAHGLGQKMSADPDRPANASAASGTPCLDPGSRGEAEAGGAVGTRPASPIRALATRRKAVMHRLPAWISARKEPPEGEKAAMKVVVGSQDAATTKAGAGGGTARASSPRESEVELLASLRYPAPQSSPPGVVIPRLIKPS